MMRARVQESRLQIRAIRKGLTTIIPSPFLDSKNLMVVVLISLVVSARDLEIWVCGKAQVDFQLLKRHTKYTGGLTDESPRIKIFWDVLSDLREDDKLRFVKFCWGQERLPANDEEFERTNTRFMIKPA